MHWFITCLKKYAVFNGRARRAEYWYFALFYWCIYVVLSLVDAQVGPEIPIPSELSESPEETERLPILSAIYSIALLLPYIAVTTRRLHDIDKSGWWQLLFFVVIIGWIPLFVWSIKSGTIGSNRFGADPKEDGDEAEESLDPNPSHPYLKNPDLGSKNE